MTYLKSNTESHIEDSREENQTFLLYFQMQYTLQITLHILLQLKMLLTFLHPMHFSSNLWNIYSVPNTILRLLHEFCKLRFQNKYVRLYYYLHF